MKDWLKISTRKKILVAVNIIRNQCIKKYHSFSLFATKLRDSMKVTIYSLT